MNAQGPPPLPPAARGLRSRRRLRGHDRRGVTDVPLELLVIVIILAIVVPIIIAALVTYTTDQQNLDVVEQADAIRDTAIQAYDDGINTSLLVTVTVPGGVQLTVGASLFLANGRLNYESSQITYGSGAGPTTCAQPGAHVTCIPVDNGATNVLVSNVTCSGWPGVATINYGPQSIPQGTTELALTKIAPGGYDDLCNGRASAPLNLTEGFVEVQAIP